MYSRRVALAHRSRAYFWVTVGTQYNIFYYNPKLNENVTLYKYNSITKHTTATQDSTVTIVATGI